MAIIVPTSVATVRRNNSNTKSILWLALSVPEWTLTQSLSLNSSSCECKWKSQVYIQNTNALTIARPHTQTYAIYTYHHLLTTFNEQSKQVSSKLRLVFRIIHDSYPGEGTGPHDVFLLHFLFFHGESWYGTMKQEKVLFPVYPRNNIL